MMKKHKFMKSLIRKIGLAIVLMSIVSIGVNAQIADFEYYNSCKGDSTHFVSTSTYPAGITAYEWIFNDGSPNGAGSEAYNVFAATGVFYVTLKIYNGTTLLDSKSKNVAIYALPVASFAVEDTCLGSPAEFVNNSSSEDGNIVGYIWNFGDGEGELIESPFHIYPNGGIFEVSLVVESYYGCRDTVTNIVSVFQLPDATIFTEATEYCQGEAITLTVDNQYQSAIWGCSNPTVNLPVDDDWFIITVEGTPVGTWLFEATVFEVNNGSLGQGATVCEDNSVIEITVHPTPAIVATADESPVIIGAEVQLEVTSSNTTLVEFVWTPVDDMNDPFIANPVVELFETTLFEASVVDEYGCENSTTVLVEVVLTADNIITPNDDGYNDVWFVASGGLDDTYEVAIFNRWGEEILSQKGYANDWDGTYEGEKLPQGAYYYVIKHDDVTYTGSITLLR